MAGILRFGALGVGGGGGGVVANRSLYNRGFGICDLLIHVLFYTSDAADYWTDFR